MTIGIDEINELQTRLSALQQFSAVSSNALSFGNYRTNSDIQAAADAEFADLAGAARVVEDRLSALNRKVYLAVEEALGL